MSIYIYDTQKICQLHPHHTVFPIISSWYPAKTTGFGAPALLGRSYAEVNALVEGVQGIHLGEEWGKIWDSPLEMYWLVVDLPL